MITFFAYNAGEQFAASDDDAMRLLAVMGERPECVGLWTKKDLPEMRRKLIKVSNTREGSAALASGVLGIVVSAQSAGTDVVWG